MPNKLINGMCEAFGLASQRRLHEQLYRAAIAGAGDRGHGDGYGVDALHRCSRRSHVDQLDRSEHVTQVTSSLVVMATRSSISATAAAAAIALPRSRSVGRQIAANRIGKKICRTSLLNAALTRDDNKCRISLKTYRFRLRM